ncbi:hypothetical protein QYF36_022872 [Acer negundo]|nr:hypothetical protein QYF36_022872 [Acer negundo]
MWKGVVAAYLIVAFCYLSVASAGYWAFGPFVEDDVLISLRKPSWLIAIANLMVFIHVFGSYQHNSFNWNLPPIFWWTAGILWCTCFLINILLSSLHHLADPQETREMELSLDRRLDSIIVGILIALLAPIGGLREIIISAQSYKMFS